MIAIEPSSVERGDIDDQLRLSFSDEIPAGEFKLKIGFTGTINDTLGGFYRAKYDRASPPSPFAVQDGEDSYMLVTHFEPCEARTAFPCFDEPRLKATFDLEIELSRAQEVLSNMPILRTSPGTQSDLKRVTFDRTPVMSTYVCSNHHRADL